MCQIDYRPKAFQAVAVALANNEIHLYKDKFLVDVIPVEENVFAMKFGRLGREDATLVLVTKSSSFSLRLISILSCIRSSGWIDHQDSETHSYLRGK